MGFESSQALDPLSEDDSGLYLTLHYAFEVGQGMVIPNLAGETPADLYSWDLDRAWGKAVDADSRGTGFLRFAPVNPDVVAENAHLIDAGRFTAPSGDDVSESADGSTIIAATETPLSLGMAEGGFTVMTWIRLERLVAGLGGPAALMTQLSATGENLLLGFDGGKALQLHGQRSFRRSKDEILPYHWHHVAWRYDRGYTDFFIDGRQSTQHPNDLQPIASINDELVFSRFSGSPGAIVGGIDDVRIYSVPLSGAKIRELAGFPKAGQEGVLVTSIRRGPDGVAFTWRDEDGASAYAVEFSQNLQNDWETIAILPEQTRIYVEQDAARSELSQGYYRVRREMAE